jgi:EAL domain-containing protein (putative c-di-GMP-specific phosphodiesterase class I)
MQQKQFLWQEGCVEGQGYLFAAPMPCATFTDLLKKGELA